MFPYQKNVPNWSYEDIKIELDKFLKIYQNRPISNNLNGVKINHAFAIFYILKKVKPNFVIESGVFKGQSTWIIEQTHPDVKILSIDPDLSQRKYISKSSRVEYSSIDFKYQKFDFPRDKILVFFDDHQNHIERIMQCRFFNIKHLIFEDNYPINRGDFYTLRHSQSRKGFKHDLTFISLFKTLYIFLIKLIKKKFFNNYFSFDELRSRIRDYYSNENEFENLTQIINIYYEFPPIIPIYRTKWGDECSNDSYKTTKSIFSENIEKNKLFELENELKYYNYLTYINLK